MAVDVGGDGGNADAKEVSACESGRWKVAGGV